MKLFTDWLLEQQHRNDLVGELAWEAAHDADWPAYADRYVEIHNYLVTQDAGDSTYLAAQQAWDEFIPLRSVLAANDFFDTLWCDGPLDAADARLSEVQPDEQLAASAAMQPA